MAAAGIRLAGFWPWILGPGYDPGLGFHWPGWSFPARRDGFVLVRRDALSRGRAAMR
jgi:hypothetical protein